jgi:signal transduction protein with GAF and PtsI domain
MTISSEEKISRLETLIRIISMLNSFLGLYEILNTTLESATEAMKAEACSILLLDEKTGKLEYLPIHPW